MLSILVRKFRKTMEGQMTKQQLIEILGKLLETEVGLWFLDKLDEHEIQTLIACVRSKVEETA